MRHCISDVIALSASHADQLASGLSPHDTRSLSATDLTSAPGTRGARSGGSLDVQRGDCLAHARQARVRVDEPRSTPVVAGLEPTDRGRVTVDAVELYGRAAEADVLRALHEVGYGVPVSATCSAQQRWTTSVWRQFTCGVNRSPASRASHAISSNDCRAPGDGVATELSRKRSVWRQGTGDRPAVLLNG